MQTEMAGVWLWPYHSLELLGKIAIIKKLENVEPFICILGTCNMENNPGRSYCTKKQKIKNKLIVLTDF